MTQSDMDVVLSSEITREAQVRALADDMRLARAVAGFFGEQREARVVDCIDSKAGLHGWLVEWSFAKPSVDGGEFGYSINVYVPRGVTVRRALEIALERFKVFVEHELREGLLYRHYVPFRPHVESLYRNGS